MGLWANNEKRCATCSYWKSKRTINTMFVDVQQNQGICLCKEGFYNLETFQGSSCLDWKGLMEMK